MFFKFKYSSEYQCVLGWVEGIASKEEVLKMLQEVYESDWYRDDMHEVWDYSCCEKMEIEVLELLEIFNFEKKVRNYGEQLKCAFIARQPMVKSILDEYCILTQDAAYDIRVFANRTQAIDWVQQG